MASSHAWSKMPPAGIGDVAVPADGSSPSNHLRSSNFFICPLNIPRD